MNQPIASNLPAARRGASRLHHPAQSGGAIAGALLRLADYLRRRLAEIGESIARDRDVRESIEHLETMSDAQLRDIGITRADIGDAVRFGRHYYHAQDLE